MRTISKNLDEQKLSVAMRLFSPSLIKELARKGQSPLLARIVNELEESLISSYDETLGHFFDTVFKLLSRTNNRNEYVYKAALTNKILLGTHSLQTAVLLSEFRTGHSKADVVILNGTSSVYEIKSERDSLEKLERQIASYRKVFAKVNVIAGTNHIHEIEKKVPEDVGIMTLSERYQISTIREAKNSPSRVDQESIFNAIQQKEAIEILSTYGRNIPTLPNTKMYSALKELFLTLSPEEAHAGMVEVLKTNRSQKTASDFINSVPSSLQALALTIPLRQKDRDTLSRAIQIPISKALQWS